jgi:hypothetical protein
MIINRTLKIHKQMKNKPVEIQAQTRIGAYQKRRLPGCLWLMPAFLAIWKAEIERIKVRSQPRQIVLGPASLK